MTVQPQDSGELGFANRAADLLQNNAWLDSPTAIAVAQQTGNTQQAQNQATLLGQALAQSWDGYEQRFYDPVLQAQPSTSYAVAQHIAATVGPAPATDGIVTLQKALQADGFLKAEPNGVWDRQTEDAYNQAVSALREQQYAGAPKKGGNPFTSTTSRLFHAVVHDVTHPWDAAVGWYDSATQAAGYFGGWLATGAGTLGTASTQAHLSGNITRALGHHVSDEQAAQAYEGSIGHRIENAAGNAVSLAVTADAAKAVGKAALQAGRAALEGGVSEADLSKLQKVGLAMGAAQRLGFVGRSVADIGDALRAGTLPASAPEVQRSLGVVSKTLLRAPLKLTGSADRLPNLVSKEWRDAVPGLARLAPVAEKIASGAEQGGWAYKVRNLMAQPYRLAPVRAAGIATQRAQIGALAAHAGANLLPGSTLSQDVSGAHTGLDSWLDNTTWNALPGVSISPDMLLLGPLHGDLVGAGRASAVIGATVHGWQNKVASALGDLGVEAAFQSILGMDRAELVNMAGSEGNLRLWINDKVNQYASDTYTQRKMAESDFTHTFTGGDAAFEDAAKTHRDAWYALPQAQRAQWVADTATADSHFTWIRNRLQADVLRGAVNPKAAVGKSMAEFFDNAKTMSELMDAGLPNYILGPASHLSLAAQGSVEDAGAVAQTVGLPSGAVGLQRTDVATREEILHRDLPKLQKAWEDARAQLKAAQSGTPTTTVPNAASNLPPLFHGTSRAFPNDKIGETAALGSGADNLFGPGFYTTDSENVARSYTSKGGGTNKAVYSVHWTGSRAPKMLNLEAKAPRVLRDWIDKAIHAPRFDAYDETLREIETKLSDPTSKGTDLVRLFRQALGEGGVTKATADETMDALADTLMNAGYDGLRHVGGTIRPGSKTQHNVSIFFDNEKLRVERVPERPTVEQLRDAVTSAFENAIDYAATQFNLDASRLGVFEHDAQGLFKTIAERAKHRASEVLPTFDQPDWMAQKLSDLKARGYRVVVGSHIGHVYDNTLPSFTKLDGFYTPLRKWAGRVGLDPGRVPDAGVSHAIRANQDALTHKFLTTTPTAVLPTPRADFRTVRAVMQDKTLTRQLPAYARGFLGLTSKIGLNKSEINRIIARTGKTEAEARAELEDAISAQFGPRDLPRKQLVDNLMTSHQVDGPGGAFNWVGVDRKTAEGIVSAYYQGYRLPGYMMGWEAAENWARAGFGIGDKLIQRNPDKPLYQAVNNWPNQLVRARNNLRFTASPVFALRVSAKQRYKAALEGVRIPFNPLQALEKQGATKQANDLLTRLDGSIPHEQLDADRYLMARDVFGIHDSTWDAAYFVHALKQQGKSAAEVKDAYRRVFKYGAQGGRTAAERTVNTIFFPFSFEKTLLRNTGAYLADRPGQALALDLAVEAWRNADKDGKVGKWVEDHMPILQEMQLLNAFSHGISPGQFGGINATILNDVKGGSEALLNLFLPQSWGKDFTKQNLSRYMPVWNQFKTLWSNVAEQQRIAGAAVHDTVRSFVAHDWKPEPVLSQRAQTSAALHTRAKWWTDKNLMAVVDYNNNQQDPADKYLWPQDDRLPVEIWGQPVNKTTLTDYLHYLYPAYDPNQGALYAKDQAAQLSAFIHQVSLTDPGKAQQMAAFRKIADSIVSHINRDDYDQATTQMAQEQFQQAAPFINSDPQWKALYDNFYAWALGQIQTPAQKAKAVT